MQRCIKLPRGRDYLVQQQLIVLLVIEVALVFIIMYVSILVIVLTA